MNTISCNSKYELIVKNSKFITLLIKVNDPSLIESILSQTKKDYPDATHYCYAFIIDNFKKSSDDGEPSNTAGLPIMKVLENNKLNYIIAIVIRYFGGIKLGANGLIRAYSKSTSNAIKENHIKELIPGYNINLTFNFNKVKQIDYLLKDCHIKQKKYLDNITYNLDIPKTFITTLDNLSLDYQILSSIYIEK